MKWRSYKKKVKKICGDDNCRFKKVNNKYYQAIRVSKALTDVSNYWMLIEFRRKNK